MSNKAVGLIFFCLIHISFSYINAKELVIYTARQEHLIKPLIDTYQKEKNVKIELRIDKPETLVQRLETEGENTPADIYMTVDVGNLWLATEKKLLEPITSEILTKNIPSHLRDENGHWFGLSIRARTIVYHTGKLKPENLSTYEDLADPKWKGKLILRTSQKVYNQSLVAMLIEKNGEEKTLGTVKGWVNNLAIDVTSDDNKVMEAIASGLGEVGIVNTYYYGRLMKKSPDLPIKLFWPNQNDGGVHVNISGAGIVKHSKNKEEAIAFLEWLSQGEAQKIFAELNMEYPVNKDTPVSAEVASWGSFKHLELPLNAAGKNQPTAVRLMKLANYK